MRSLAGAALRAPKSLAAVLGLILLFSITSLAPPANADPEPNLSVSVVDANGDDIDGATVHVEGGTSPSELTVDGEASFELASGNYQLSAARPTLFPSAAYRDDDDAVATIMVAGDTVTINGEVVEDGALTMTLQSTPKTVSGTVLGSDNAGLVGITVQAVPEDGPTITTQSTMGGNFTLPLPIGTYTVTYLGAVVGNHTYVNTPYAGGDVAVTQTTTPTLNAQKLAIDDGSTRFDLKGTAYDWEGNALNGVAVTVLPATGGAVVAAATTQKMGEDDGAFKIGVRPGKYQLRFEKAGYATTYLDNGVDEGPVTVTVSATGTVSAPDVDFDTDGSLPDVTLLLSPATVVQAPKLSGKAAVGQTLTVSAGTWKGIDVDTDYVSVDWFIDGKPADDYSDGGWLQKFEVPLAAVGKKIGFKLTVDDPEGAHASSVFGGSTGVVPKAATKLKGAFKKGRLGITLTVAGLPKPTGSIVVKDRKKTVATIKLKAKSKGKGVVTLSKLKPGKHTLTLSYAGSKAVNAAKVKVVVKK